MQVAITDFKFPSLQIEQEILLPAGIEIVSGQCRTAAELIPLVANADAVLTQFAPIDAQVVGAMHKARVIVRYGIGVDNVDLAAARAKGIPVCNVPDYCIDEVADHTLAFILAMTRQVIANHQYVSEGKWGLAVPLPLMKALYDQTVGIVGFGRIGRAVAERLRPFKCRRLAYDPALEPAAAAEADCTLVPLEKLFAESDIITLHCPSTSQTRRMVNRESLQHVKPGTILINLARGDLIETEAMVAALTSGQLGGAALDVCDPEPMPLEGPLRKMSNVICASHVASTSVKATTRLRRTAAQIALQALRGEPLSSVVN